MEDFKLVLSYKNQAKNKQTNKKQRKKTPSRREITLSSTSANSKPAAEDVAKLSVKKTHLGAGNEPETSTPGGPFEKKVLRL